MKRGRLTRQLIRLVSDRIAGCDCCSKHRPQMFVEEVYACLGLTNSETKRVVRYYCCPICDAGPHLYQTLACFEANEWRDRSQMHKWKQRYASGLRSLVDLLTATPSLGLVHPVGRDLHKAVRRARVTRCSSGPWWRACRKDQETSPPTSRFTPGDPHDVSIPAQRFNHAGQATTLYVSDSRDTAS